MRRQPERAEQRGIVRVLQHIGARPWVLGTTRRRGDYHGTMQTPGLPDLIAHLPCGRGVLFVEVKAKGGRLRPEQAEFRLACTACLPPHQVHHVVGGLDSVIAYLIHLGLLKTDAVPHDRMTEAAHDFTAPRPRRRADTEQERG